MRVLKLDPTLCEKVIRLSATDSKLKIQTKRGGSKNKPEFKIILSYNTPYDMASDLVEINTLEKIARFSEEPKSYDTETGCIDLAKYLQGQNYEVKGMIHFLNERMFKPHEFSLF